MDNEKYPHYFLIVIVLYAMIFVAGLSYFIIPSLSFGIAYADFYMIAILFFLPLILLALYTRLEDHLGKVRLAVTILTVVDFIFMLYLIILLL